MIQEKPNIQPSSNLDLQPSDNVKKGDRGGRKGRRTSLGLGHGWFE